jgi:hypothetical protein
MIPQDRELEGLSVYFLFFLITLLSKGGDQLCEPLREGQEVLGSPRGFLNPPLVLWGGSSLTDDFLLISHSLTHFSLTHSHACTPMHPLTHSSIHPHLRLGLEKEMELLKN